MTLVDTSVIVDSLRFRTESVRATLIRYEAAICGVTQAEVLFGARTDGAHIENRL